MLGPLAYMFAWAAYLAVAGLAVVLSTFLQLLPAARGAAFGFRAGVLHSIPGVMLLHALTIPVCLAALLLVSLVIGPAVSPTFATEAPLWWPPVAVSLVLGVPLLGSLFGAYLGFRVGWERALDRDPMGLIERDWLIGHAAAFGSWNPVRSYLSFW